MVISLQMVYVSFALLDARIVTPKELVKNVILVLATQ